MAVIGARPAQRPWYRGGLGAPRSRPCPRPRVRPYRGHTAGRVHRARRTAARMELRPLLVAIVIAVGLALFYLSQSTRVAATGYEIETLEAALAERLAEQQQLVWAIGRARSPAEITDRARQELGLVPLDAAAVTFVVPTVAPPPWSTIDD